jgi:hypothetical protein
MQTSGLLIMIASVGTVTAVFAWCIRKVLACPATEMDRLQPADFHTPDEDRD